MSCAGKEHLAPSNVPLIDGQLSVPYRTTPVFDETSLPAALRHEHRTKAGVWGVIRVLAGEVVLTSIIPWRECRLTPGHPGMILPDDPHFVTLVGATRMQVEFYNHPPVIHPTPTETTAPEAQSNTATVPTLAKL